MTLRIWSILLLLGVTCHLTQAHQQQPEDLLPRLGAALGARPSFTSVTEQEMVAVHQKIALAEMEANQQLMDDDMVVSTTQGYLRGFVDRNTGTRKWLGVPFAAPPVGDLRFKRPEQAWSWTGIRNATKFGSSCLQDDAVLYKPVDEDCLYLNVFAPTNVSASPLPVMFWIFGGGFVHGGGNMFVYWGDNLVNAGNVILVTINYRLSALGWFVHPALENEDPTYPASGNYGIWDQLAALKWVKANIAGFGGDPNQITVFGESAGSISTCLHMTMPWSAGLFKRAILESGPCLQGTRPTSTSLFSYDIARSLSARFIEKVNCTRTYPIDEIACVRALPAQVVLNNMVIGTTFADWRPVRDNFTVIDEPLNLFMEGKTNNVSVLIGTNTDEGTMFVDANLTASGYAALLQNTFPEYHEYVSKIYPLDKFASPFYAAAEIQNDWLFYCPSRRLLKLQPATTVNYQYHFNHTLSWVYCPGPFCEKLPLKVYHSSELFLVFGNAVPFYTFSPEEDLLVDNMMAYWTSFARGGAPVGAYKNSPVWPKYTWDSRLNALLDDEIAINRGYKDNVCDFWDALTFPAGL